MHHRTIPSGHWGRFALVCGAAALLLAASGCHDDDDNNGTPKPTATAKPTNTPKSTNTPKPTSTPTRPGDPTNTPAARTSTPTATATARPQIQGNYAANIPLDGGQTAHINVSVDSSGHATGSLEVVGNGSAIARSRLGTVASGISISVGYANISGEIDPSTGAFHFSGNIALGGTSTSFDLSGNLPTTPGGTGSVTATINGHTYTASIGAGVGPTPLPTQSSQPTPTPVAGGCADGVLHVTYSNVNGANAETSDLTLGKVTALDTPDSQAGRYVWVISANECDVTFGELGRGVVIQGFGVVNRIEPGTYTLGVNPSGILAISYVQSLLVANPAERQTRMWGASTGTLTISDAGGGNLSIHAENVAMAPQLGIAPGEGTFTLDITGTISHVSH